MPYIWLVFSPDLPFPLTIAVARDKVLEPASAVLTTPMPGDTDSEKVVLDEMFDKGLPASTLVRYRQDLAGSHGDPFLCYNWALHRIKNDLVKDKPFPKEQPEGTTEYDAAEMEKQLNKVGLVACGDTDENRVCLAVSLTTL